MTDTYREISPYQGDDGQKIGRTPSSVPRRDLEALGHPQTPLRAIRANGRGRELEEKIKNPVVFQHKGAAAEMGIL